MWHIKKDDGKSIIVESLNMVKQRGNKYIIYIYTENDSFTISEDDTFIVGAESIFIGKCDEGNIWTYVININKVESIEFKELRNKKEENVID